MILIVRHLHDPLADALAAVLAAMATMAAGPDSAPAAAPPRICVIEQWLAACRIEHRVSDAGTASRFDVAGRALLDEQVSVILNRVRHVAPPACYGRQGEDRDYAASEAAALFWSCMAGLPCPVYNSATALGLVGGATHPLAWMGEAAAAGLPTRDVVMGTGGRRAGIALPTAPAAWGGPSDAATAGGKTMPVAWGAPSDAAAAGHAVWPGGGTSASGTWLGGDASASDAWPSGGASDGAAWLGGAGNGAAGMLWIVGDTVLGSLPGVATDGARRFARAIGIGLGVLHFERDRYQHWRLHGYDALPRHAPALVVHILAAQLAALASPRMPLGSPA